MILCLWGSWLLFWLFGLFGGDHDHGFLLLCTLVTLLAIFRLPLLVPGLDEVVHIKGRPLHFLPALVSILLGRPHLGLVPAFPARAIDNVAV